MHMARSEPGPLKLQDMTELDRMIRQGYGDVPQWQLPDNWQTVRREDQTDWHVRHAVGIPEEMLPRHGGRRDPR